MLTLNEACEQLALTLPRFDASSLDGAALALAAVYRGEIYALPIGGTTIGRESRLTDDELHKLCKLVIRDLQDWGRTILVERGLAGGDDLHGRHNPFLGSHVTEIREAWDALPDAPVWVAFGRQFSSLRGH